MVKPWFLLFNNSRQRIDNAVEKFFQAGNLYFQSKDYQNALIQLIINVLFTQKKIIIKSYTLRNVLNVNFLLVRLINPLLTV